MRLKNASLYPDREVQDLIEFGMHGVVTTGLVVRVTNSRDGSYHGHAYDGIPARSPAIRLVTAERLVTIRVPARDKFPLTNMVTSRRWLPWQPRGSAVPDGWTKGWPWEGRYFTIDAAGREIMSPEVVEERWGKLVRHPYGGLRSPLIKMANWQECLVALAAHESRHIHQFRHDRPHSEVDAEKFAAKALVRFRGR